MYESISYQLVALEESPRCLQEVPAVGGIWVKTTCEYLQCGGNCESFNKSSASSAELGDETGELDLGK